MRETQHNHAKKLTLLWRLYYLPFGRSIFPIISRSTKVLLVPKTVHHTIYPLIFEIGYTTSSLETVCLNVSLSVVSVPLREYNAGIYKMIMRIE